MRLAPDLLTRHSMLTQRTVAAAFLLLAACGDDTDIPLDSNRSFIIKDEPSKWSTVVADYADGRFDDLNFVSELRTVTLQSGEEVTGIYQYGLNISDDLFKGVWRRIEGLPAGFQRLIVTATVATPSPAGCDIGGGANVYLKVGLFVEEPDTEIIDGYVHTTFDKGQQSVPGATMPVVGDARNEIPGCNGQAWGVKSVQTSQPIEIEVGEDGIAYVVLASESAFEVGDDLVYLQLSVETVP